MLLSVLWQRGVLQRRAVETLDQGTQVAHYFIDPHQLITIHRSHSSALLQVMGDVRPWGKKAPDAPTTATHGKKSNGVFLKGGRGR